MQNDTHKAPPRTHIGCHNLDRPTAMMFGDDGAEHVSLQVTPEVTLYFDSFAEFHKWVSTVRVELLDMRAQEVA